jgi:hypothetical protein
MEVIVNPHSKFTAIVSFDGHVLELFYGEADTGAHRFHITHITAVSFGPDKKGRQILEFKTRSGLPHILEVEPEKVGEVQGLVEAVLKAIGQHP